MERGYRSRHIDYFYFVIMVSYTFILAQSTDSTFGGFRSSKSRVFFRKISHTPYHL